MWVPSLGWEETLKKEMTTHSNILAWRIPMDREAWRATVHRVAKSRTQQKRVSMQHIVFQDYVSIINKLLYFLVL